MAFACLNGLYFSVRRFSSLVCSFDTLYENITSLLRATTQDIRSVVACACGTRRVLVLASLWCWGAHLSSHRDRSLCKHIFLLENRRKVSHHIQGKAALASLKIMPFSSQLNLSGYLSTDRPIQIPAFATLWPSSPSFSDRPAYPIAKGHLSTPPRSAPRSKGAAIMSTFVMWRFSLVWMKFSSI